ncbi:ABC transporter ATP-binding protein [Corynebacterium sp. 335C]
MSRLRSLLRPTFEGDTRTADAAADRFPVAGFRETMAHLGHLTRHNRGRLIAALAVLVAAAWAGIMVPKLMGRIVDVVLSDGGVGDVAALAGRMALAAACAGLLSGLGFRLLAGLAERAIADLREDMVSTVLRLPVQRVERAGAGDVVSRATDDVAQVSTAVTQTLPVAAGAVFTVLVSIAGVGTVDWRFMLAFLVVLPVHWLAVRTYLRIAPPVYAAERAAMAERARVMLSTIHGRPAVRAFRLEDLRRRGISRWSWQTVRHTVDARITHNMTMTRMHVAEFLGTAVTLVLGFYLVRAGHVTVGGATAAMLLFMRLFSPLTRMVMVLDVAQSGATSLTRIVGVLRERPAPHGTASPEPGRGVELDGVGFSYGGGRPAVRDVDLRIAEGETMALVGSSGAGKSTLAAIVAGLRPASAGTVRVCGHDMTADAEAARGRIVALVTQEVHVFEGTLREDLVLGVRGEDAASGAALDDGTPRGGAPGSGGGRDGASGSGARPVDEASSRADGCPVDDDAILAALAAVGADWVDRLPDGLDTLVGHGGMRLDPVAAQQVALARLLLADPPVVVLDEATAEAGSAGAGELGEAALKVIEGRTALIVAHRLDQAAAADRVAVMEDGRIIECGPHEELVRAGGRYSELWRAWEKGRVAG